MDKYSVITIIANSDAGLSWFRILVRVANWQMKKIYKYIFRNVWVLQCVQGIIDKFRVICFVLCCILLLLDLPIKFRVIWMTMRGSQRQPPWWRYQVEAFSAALCDGKPPVTGGFPSQRPLTWSFDVFFIWTSANGWANNRDAWDLRRRRAHYDATVMQCKWSQLQ